MVSCMTSVQTGFFDLCEMGNHCLFLNYNDGKCKHFQGKSNILISHVLSTPFQQLLSHEVMASPVSSQPLSLSSPKDMPGDHMWEGESMTPGLDVDQRELSFHFILLNFTALGFSTEMPASKIPREVISSLNFARRQFYTQGDTV